MFNAFPKKHPSPFPFYYKVLELECSYFVIRSFIAILFCTHVLSVNKLNKTLPTMY